MNKKQNVFTDITTNKILYPEHVNKALNDICSNHSSNALRCMVSVMFIAHFYLRQV